MIYLIMLHNNLCGNPYFGLQRVHIYIQYDNIVQYTLSYCNYCNYTQFVFSITDVTHKTYPSRLVTTSQLDNYAVDNIIIQCVDDGPSDDRADNYSVSSHHQIVGRRRCRPVTTATSKCKWFILGENYLNSFII